MFASSSTHERTHFNYIGAAAALTIAASVLASCASPNEGATTKPLPEYEKPFTTSDKDTSFLRLSIRGAEVVSIGKFAVDIDGEAKRDIGPLTSEERYTGKVNGEVVGSLATVEPRFSTLYCDNRGNLTATSTAFRYLGKTVQLENMVIGDSCSHELVASSGKTVEVVGTRYPVVH